MSRDDALSAPRAGPVAVPDWLAPAVLLVGTVMVGGMLGSLVRPLFVLGCGVIGWYAWRKGPAAHVYSVLLLFAFAPFARRIVDLSLGFDYGAAFQRIRRVAFPDPKVAVAALDPLHAAVEGPHVVDPTAFDATFHALFASEEAGVADMPMRPMVPIRFGRLIEQQSDWVWTSVEPLELSGTGDLSARTTMSGIGLPRT